MAGAHALGELNRHRTGDRPGARQPDPGQRHREPVHLRALGARVERRRRLHRSLAPRNCGLLRHRRVHHRHTDGEHLSVPIRVFVDVHLRGRRRRPVRGTSGRTHVAAARRLLGSRHTRLWRSREGHAAQPRGNHRGHSHDRPAAYSAAAGPTRRTVWPA